ncbi:echinoidin-like [Patiria miniata]|uniref:C-type lectin domain-containing protein n=1 Tax=Patiria miniata TaxID=46514 RepID=A0A913Z5S5_PATMI|nr:echinoidin-like [Patiria miniata]
MKLLILTCLTLCLVACEAQLTCPTYWTRNGNSCYRTFGLAQTYMRANDVCQLFTSCGSTGTSTGQGHLVSINSKEENDFVFSFLAGRYGEIPPPPGWLGLSDYDPEQGGQGNFRWADGTIPGSSTFSAWANNAPRQNGNINCAVFGEMILPRWIDIPCEEELPYICEVAASVDACSAASMPPATNPPPSPLLTSPNKPKTIRYSKKHNKYSEPV